MERVENRQHYDLEADRPKRKGKKAAEVETQQVPLVPGERKDEMLEQAREETLAAFPIPPKCDSFAQQLEDANFNQYGTMGRALLILLLDVSPSVNAYILTQLLPAVLGLKGVLAGDKLVRNFMDVVVILGARDAQVLGVQVGDISLPDPLPLGDWTNGLPWMEAMLGTVAQYRDHLRVKGIRQRWGMTAVYSDLLVDDKDQIEKALPAWKAAMKAHRQVVLGATFGRADREMAAKFSAPLEPVDSAKVPLKLLLETLTRTMRDSLTVTGDVSLEDQLKAEVERLNRQA